MNLFRFEIVLIDGSIDYGMAFGSDDKDVADYLYFPGVKRIHVFQCDDITWPAFSECPMGE